METIRKFLYNSIILSIFLSSFITSCKSKTVVKNIPQKVIQKNDSLISLKDTVIFGGSTEGNELILLINKFTQDSIIKSEAMGEIGKSVSYYRFNSELKEVKRITYYYNAPFYMKGGGKIKDSIIETLLTSDSIKQELLLSFKEKKKIFSKQNIKIKEDQNDCKEITGEMSKCEECIIKIININDLYSKIIQGKEIEKSIYLLKEIPLKSKKVSINEDGLISITYKINKNKVEIEMLYDGGITVISLEKKNSDVKQSICYYFD